MQGQTIRWSGREWKVTRGGMAGVAKGDPANVTIDGKGYLHLRIAKRDGQWTSAEVFTVEEMGFGTYQWIVEGDVYRTDPTTVLGLFPYGPVHKKGADAENEIDIEFSQWNKTCHGCDADFTVYPATGKRRPEGKSAWEDNFYVDGGTLTTARIEWSRERIVFTLMNGAKAIGIQRSGRAYLVGFPWHRREGVNTFFIFGAGPQEYLLCARRRFRPITAAPRPSFRCLPRS